MQRGLIKIILKSLQFYRKSVLIQVVIIAVLTAVITGSLLTGYSVRKSLRTTAFSRIGNTSILISSGLRYFDPDLSVRLEARTGEKSVALLEINGFCQKFTEEIKSEKVKIFAIGSDFFRFQGIDSISLKPGEAAINRKVALRLNLKSGDQIIIRFRNISDLPADAPFAPAQAEGNSLVLKVGRILGIEKGGDFSLGISQIVPSNLFINLSDLNNNPDQKIRVNRLLVENREHKNITGFSSGLRSIINLSDLGLTIRRVSATGAIELVSDRIFIEKTLIDDVKNIIPTAYPLITYLANSLTSGNRSTPYSFISALPPETVNTMLSGSDMVINKWLASDLNVATGDTIRMSWYSPDSINQLKEKSDRFIISKIVEPDSIWGDRTLMPDFPGISGRESCSDWDAGVMIKMDRIRKKDEDYWKDFKGTPKAFISYDKGKELWGNNYGPATAIRFPATLSREIIEQKLREALEPEKEGYIITDLRQNALKAAEKSVDFGTLFLSLSFFMILSSILLLSLSVSGYFEQKKDQLRILFSIGFTERLILRMLFSETMLISLTGSIIGAFSGLLVNNIIIGALNSVWRGAVQTDTLSASLGMIPLLTGFISSTVLLMVFFRIRTKKFLKKLNAKREGTRRPVSLKLNLILLLVSVAGSVSLFVASCIFKYHSIQLSFIAGIFTYLTIVLLARHYYIGGLSFKMRSKKNLSDLLKMYYRNTPSHAIAPVIFIATGIFALFITSLNRINSGKEATNASGGTGGYQYWCETAIPVKEDLSAVTGITEYGLDDDQLKGIGIVQIARKEGDDASCLNLNHVSIPPLLGVDPQQFIIKGSFSFASVLHEFRGNNPWELLDEKLDGNVIYGIADQTVLEWGLKLRCGDTLSVKAETGQKLNIIIAAGLKSSVFQGNILIGKMGFRKYFPSVSGSSVFLIDKSAAVPGSFTGTLENRFSSHGMTIEPAVERLTSFNQVTNTYLAVFTILGTLGMILGIIGLGFNLLRNYALRKREFALLSATGFSMKKIKKTLLSDLLMILATGIVTGLSSAFVATFQSIRGNTDLPWGTLSVMIFSILLTGVLSLLVSVSRVKQESLITSLRKD